MEVPAPDRSQSQRLRVACLQTTPGDDIVENTESVLELARRAASAGAHFILTPEYTSILHSNGQAMRDGARLEPEHLTLAALREFAFSAGCWMLIGSLTVKVDGDDRIANRSYLVDSRGEIVARYDKLHMFDATLPSGRVIRESSLYRPGERGVLAETPWGRVGMTICYDLRFPHLYRSLAQAGARILVVPAAFTQSTGPLHWHALLRARAIENGSFVLAPATCGVHGGGHATYGHSLIVDPMGRILADGGDDPGIVAADIDCAAVESARALIPSLRQDCSFTI